MRVIIAHHILHIEAANEAAKQTGQALVFQSPEHGLRVHGLAMLMALFDGQDWILDCRFEAALAVEAMRLGLKKIRLSTQINQTMLSKLQDIAKQTYTEIIMQELDVLDLGQTLQPIQDCVKFLTKSRE